MNSNDPLPRHLALQARALQKKLRQARDLRQQAATGKTLNDQQRQKVLAIPELEEELACMEQDALAPPQESSPTEKQVRSPCD